MTVPPPLPSPSTPRTNVISRMLGEIYASAQLSSSAMRLFALVGLAAAVLMLILAFVVVAAEGEEARVAAIPLAIVGIIYGVTSFFLRRAAQSYRRAYDRRDLSAFVDGVAFENAYWRMIALVAIAAIVLAVAGLLLARFANFLQPGRVKRTVAEMRVTRDALEKYAAQNYRYPGAKNMEQLAIVLRPFAEKPIAQRDGWGTPYRYVPVCHAGSCYDYRLISAAANRDFEVNAEKMLSSASRYECIACPGRDIDLDIILGDGRFLLMPEKERKSGD